MRRYCLALDLKDDPDAIAQYVHWHENVWPEIRKSILDSDIRAMEIYRTGNRLFMIIEAGDTFSFEAKASMDVANQKVQEWERLMENYQQKLPWAEHGQKWVIMEKIFDLKGNGKD